MTNVIWYYLRDKKRQPIGVLVAIKSNDHVLIGWSKCNVRLDKFSRSTGLFIAESRALSGSVVSLPREVAESYEDFCKRASKYFKVSSENVHDLNYYLEQRAKAHPVSA